LKAVRRCRKQTRVSMRKTGCWTMQRGQGVKGMRKRMWKKRRVRKMRIQDRWMRMASHQRSQRQQQKRRHW
jgi:hypothetical protein